jgi:hypothetical protein
MMLYGIFTVTLAAVAAVIYLVWRAFSSDYDDF